MNALFRLLQRLRLSPWLVWGIGALFAFYQFLLQTAPSVMTEDLMHHFKVDSVGVGFMSASFFFSYILFQIPAGLLIDRWGVRRLYLICIPMATLSCLAFALAPTVWVADISRFLTGMFAAPGVVGAMLLASNWFPATQFAIIAGLTETLCLLGGAIGDQLLAFLILRQNWQIALEEIALGGALLTVMTWLFVRDRNPTLNAATAQAKHPPKALWPIFKAVLSSKQMWALGGYCGLSAALISAFGVLWGVHFIQTQYHASLQMAAFAAGLVFIGTATGAPLISWVSNKMGRRRPLMIYTSLITLILSMLAFYTPLPLTLMLPILFLLGLFGASYMLAFIIAREISHPDVRGTSMGFLNMMCTVIGAPILQPFIGLLLHHHWQGKMQDGIPLYSTGDYHFALAVLPVTIATALLLVPLIKETYCKLHETMVSP